MPQYCGSLFPQFARQSCRIAHFAEEVPPADFIARLRSYGTVIVNLLLIGAANSPALGGPSATLPRQLPAPVVNDQFKFTGWPFTVPVNTTL